MPVIIYNPAGGEPTTLETIYAKRHKIYVDEHDLSKLEQLRFKPGELVKYFSSRFEEHLKRLRDSNTTCYRAYDGHGNTTVYYVRTYRTREYLKIRTYNCILTD